jgi:hypothetical protein
MARRAIKNIDKESYPLIGELIRNFPELFAHTEMIGIFEGKDICSSFLLNSEYCNSITFYENLQFTSNKKTKKQFCNLYNDWEKAIPNLTVKIENGQNFIGNSSFVLIDTTIPLAEFIQKNIDKLKNSWAVSPGYGINFVCTSQFFELIRKDKIFPILIYRDYFFYCFNQTVQKSILNKINNYIQKNLHFNKQTDHKVNFYQLLDEDTSDI